jgi:biotin-dependent carboxylase-like uncharacterized protein
MTAQLEVLRAGALSTVQDLGRRGLAHLAVPTSGALDEPALRLANRLVGNPEGCAAVETTVDGIVVRLDSDRYIAVTGADADVLIGGRPAAWGMAQLVRAGDVVEVARARRGMRNYLAVAGGLLPNPVLGSRSTDLLSGLGPEVLRRGSLIQLGEPAAKPARLDFAPYRMPTDELTLSCYLGPRDDWFTADAIRTLASTPWMVTEQGNRIALSLNGNPLTRHSSAELPSEGVVLGSVQVPADGQPVIFLADHPTTGGYPVVGVVPAPDVWLCGQARPGTTVRFRLRRLPSR